MHTANEHRTTGNTLTINWDLHTIAEVIAMAERRNQQAGTITTMDAWDLLFSLGDLLFFGEGDRLRDPREWAVLHVRCSDGVVTLCNQDGHIVVAPIPLLPNLGH
jgi:hypothetical protein